MVLFKKRPKGEIVRIVIVALFGSSLFMEQNHCNLLRHLRQSLGQIKWSMGSKDLLDERTGKNIFSYIHQDCHTWIDTALKSFSVSFCINPSYICFNPFYRRNQLIVYQKYLLCTWFLKMIKKQLSSASSFSVLSDICFLKLLFIMESIVSRQFHFIETIVFSKLEIILLETRFLTEPGSCYLNSSLLKLDLQILYKY